MSSDDLYIHKRKSIRLRGYDYTKHGEYFSTICCFQRFHYFGEITDGVITTTDLGRLVIDEWIRIPQHRPKVALQDYRIMPNHFHGIIVIKPSSDGEARFKGTTFFGIWGKGGRGGVGGWGSLGSFFLLLS